jgi:hypothetical protein
LLTCLLLELTGQDIFRSVRDPYILLKISLTIKGLKGWLRYRERNLIIIRMRIMTESTSTNPDGCEIPGTIDLPKKLNSQYPVRTRMIT